MLENIQIIACETVKNELEFAMKEAGVNYPVTWIDSGLHSSPLCLHRKLQDAIDCCTASVALLGLGFCGNSVAGLKTGDFRLIIPRRDDCISLLLDPSEIRGGGTYFMTEGWLRDESHLYHEYKYTIEKYGEEEGREIFDIMLHNYNSIALLDTGCYPIGPVEEETRRFADILGLKFKLVRGNTDWLRRLLTGPWDDERFIVVPPRSAVPADELFERS